MKRLLAAMLLMQATCVQADVYTWTDGQGIAHYTNKAYEIPERYRARAKPLHLESVEPASTPQQGTPPQPQGTPSTPQAAPSPPPQAPSPAVTAPVSPAPAGETASPRGMRRRNPGDGQGATK